MATTLECPGTCPPTFFFALAVSNAFILALRLAVVDAVVANFFATSAFPWLVVAIFYFPVVFNSANAGLCSFGCFILLRAITFLLLLA